MAVRGKSINLFLMDGSASGRIYYRRKRKRASQPEEFIDYAKVIMRTLGHKVFEPLNRVILEKGKKFTRQQKRAGFVVLKGSHISPKDDDTVPAAVKERRKSASIDGHGNLTEDLLFSSLSYAAMFVIGKSANGVTSWKTEDNRTP